MTVLAGCSSGGGTETSASSPPVTLPEATTLLAESATGVGTLTSAQLSLNVNGTVPGLDVQSIDGDFTKTGDAKGTGKIAMAGQLAEIEFVLAGGSLYIKGPTGGFQQIPPSAAAGVYDPRVILDPGKGLPALLATVTDAKTVGNEDVNGKPTMKITGKVSKERLAVLLPGVPMGADATFWLEPDAKHLPVKVTLSFPGNISADVNVSDVDKPVTVAPPA